METGGIITYVGSGTRLDELHSFLNRNRILPLYLTLRTILMQCAVKYCSFLPGVLLIGLARNCMASI